VKSVLEMQRRPHERETEAENEDAARSSSFRDWVVLLPARTVSDCERGW